MSFLENNRTNEIRTFLDEYFKVNNKKYKHNFFLRLISDYGDCNLNNIVVSNYSNIKRNVWNKYIGEDIGKSLCLCCKLTEINRNYTIKLFMWSYNFRV
jgi:hypothetical protein